MLIELNRAKSSGEFQIKRNIQLKTEKKKKKCTKNEKMKKNVLKWQLH